ncbi:MAG TPA: long-chain fatty acid--CoA ligase [Actinocrinis sp.]|nr:long-chain fatty acid--CoA ligase [Actinocrinis sp.]
MSFNLAVMLRESALAFPDRDCVRIGDHSVTYAQIDERSGRVAAGLLASGLRRGDKVAVQLPNIPAFLEAYFGILKAGLVMVPLNPQLKHAEIAHQLADSQSRAAVTFSMCVPEMTAAAKEIEDLALYTVALPGFDVDSGTPEGYRPFESLLGDGPVPGPGGSRSGDIVATMADDTAVIIYTSGTTGRPKGAELTHFQLFMNCTTSSALFGIEPDDISLAVLPFFHIYGLSSVINCAVRHGGTMSLVPRFDAQSVVDAMERHEVSVFVGVPTMYQALMQVDTTGRDLSRLRVASSGGAAMPEALMRAFEEKFGILILEGYGLSETASAAVMNQGANERKPLSIGKPIWGVEMRIVAADGRDLPPGTENVGEILLRGHNVMKGYYRDPEGTAAALRDGWLHTGDLAYQDEDGFVFIVDRIKDLIIRGGYNVYPREVEEVLYTHPAVAEAAVVGRADERLGEEVVAVVALRPGAEADAEALIAYCRENLAGYKCPREVRFLPELPKNATGKLLKRELRGLLD